MIQETLLNSTGWLLAQAASRTWVDALLEIKTDKLVLVLIFGAGLISALGYALAQVIRAANGSVDDSEELQSQIEDLQQRVAQLEKSAHDSQAASRADACKSLC